MKYISTRGHAGQPANPEFCDILLGGLAPDGGLYLPEHYPQVTRAELDAWRGLSYAELAFAILSKFITDIPPADLKAICDKTFFGSRPTRSNTKRSKFEALEMSIDGLEVTWVSAALRGRYTPLRKNSSSTSFSLVARISFATGRPIWRAM